MEESVLAAGALPVLVCTAILSVFWAVPQCLFIAELASMFDVNGGFVVVRGGEQSECWRVCWRVCTNHCAAHHPHPLLQWVDRGLGRYWAFVNGANSVFSSWLDNPL